MLRHSTIDSLQGVVIVVRRVNYCAVGCNGQADADVLDWGTSVLLTVGRKSRVSHAKTLVFFGDDTAVGSAGASLAYRIAIAQLKWLFWTPIQLAFRTQQGPTRLQLLLTHRLPSWKWLIATES